MKTVNIASKVSNAMMVGKGKDKKVLVVVNTGSVKAFNQSVIADSDVRRTKRWSPERDIDNAVKNYVRWVAGFHGKHLANIEIVTGTNKPDLFRKANGQFLKI